MKKTSKEFMNLSLSLMRFCENNSIDKTKYFIKQDEIMGKTFTIAKHEECGSYSISTCGRFYTQGELTAWMDGYTSAKKNIF
jgi:hypothetical protein